ncbi:MAG TPA: hypothetical protein VI072_01625 [Polyangiaceae bacterium]
MPPVRVHRARVPLSRFGAWTLSRAQRYLRLATYLGLVFALVSALAARSVHGSVGEAAFALGRQLASFEDVTRSSYRVRLNGESVNVASATLDEPIVVVLGRFERACVAGSPFAVDAAAPRREAPVERALTPEAGVLRRDSGKEGLLVCLVRARNQQLTLAQRWARWSRSLELSEVGLLRYVYAARTASGRTRLFVAWTDGPFQLGALFADGDQDATGDDLHDGARPRGSVRLLTARIEGTEHSTRIYASELAPEAVLSGFDRDMQSRGWRALLVRDVVENGRAYARDGVDALVFAFPDARGSVVSLVESRSKRAFELRKQSTR